MMMAVGLMVVCVVAIPVLMILWIEFCPRSRRIKREWKESERAWKARFTR